MTIAKNLVTYVGTFPDGSQLMVQRFLDDFGQDLEVVAATRPRADRSIVWSPPIVLTRD